MTNTPAAGNGSSPLGSSAKGVTAPRRTVGLTLAALGLPALTAALVAARGTLALDSVLLVYLLAVVVISVVGGIVAGLSAAAASFALANFYLTPPYHTFHVESRDRLIALVVFLLVAVTVSTLVDLAARRQAATARSQAEARLLDRVAAQPLASRSAEDVLSEVLATFGLTASALVERIGAEDTVLARVGVDIGPKPWVQVPAGANRSLVGVGPKLFAEDRQLLGRLARAASEAFDARQLATEAESARRLAEVDRLRSALLAAVGHDLRTPLAGIKAAATTLTQTNVHIAAADRAELLSGIVASADHLEDLISNLLDLSRLEAGALHLDLAPVSYDEVVARALLGCPAGTVANRIRDDLPMVRADSGLLERVVANLVDNAVRHSPPGSPVRIDAEATEGTVALNVIDSGPGVTKSEWRRMFVPFQRLDDHSSGVGLGLAIAKGFTEAVGGTLVPSGTPGGGLTMTLTMPRAEDAHQ